MSTRKNLIAKVTSLSMLNVYFTFYDKPLPLDRYQSLLEALPNEIINRVKSYIHWQDSHASLFGKLLLLKSLEHFGYEKRHLNEIKYTRYKRPFIGNGIDFNISHSGNYVICVTSDEFRVGIDIEKIEPIPIHDFINQWSKEELEEILACKDVFNTFYQLWTKKEAVAKADGRGLNVFNNIIVNQQIATIETKRWYIQELKLADGYIVHLVTDNVIPYKLSIKRINYYSTNIFDWI